MKNVKQAPQLNPIHHIGGQVFRFDTKVVKNDGFEFNATMQLIPKIVVNQLYRTLHKGRWKQVSTKKGNELHRIIHSTNN